MRSEAKEKDDGYARREGGRTGLTVLRECAITYRTSGGAAKKMASETKREREDEDERERREGGCRHRTMGRKLHAICGLDPGNGHRRRPRGGGKGVVGCDASCRKKNGRETKGGVRTIYSRAVFLRIRHLSFLYRSCCCLLRVVYVLIQPPPLCRPFTSSWSANPLLLLLLHPPSSRPPFSASR